MSEFIKMFVLLSSAIILYFVIAPNGLYSYLLFALLTVCFAKLILVLSSIIKKKLNSIENG
jgi:hypothetical protein